jgi:hypothetical protein
MFVHCFAEMEARKMAAKRNQVNAILEDIVENR